MQEAKYLGVAPWELLEQPIIWRKIARESSKSEAHAQKMKQDRKARRSGKGLGS